MPVGQHLRLDMAGAVQELLDEAFAATKGGQRLSRGGFEQFFHFLQPPGDLHAAPAAAVGRLDRDGQPVGLGKGAGLGGRLHGTGGAGDQEAAVPESSGAHDRGARAGGRPRALRPAAGRRAHDGVRRVGRRSRR